MKSRRMFITLISVTRLLIGCATPRMDTASGRPEVTIAAPKSKARSALATEVVNRGAIIISDTESALIAEKDATAGQKFWFTNLATGEEPKIRFRFTLIELDGKTRIVGAAMFAHAPGFSGRAAEMDMISKRSNEQMQYLLDCVSAAAESRPRPVEPVYSAPPKVASPKD